MTEQEIIQKTEQRLKDIKTEIKLHKKQIQRLKGQKIALNSVIFAIKKEESK